MADTTTEEELIQALSKVLLLDEDEEEVEGLDEDLVSYIGGLLSAKVGEEGHDDKNEFLTQVFEEILDPFLESINCPDHLVQKAQRAVQDVLHVTSSSSVAEKSASTTRKLTQGMVSMSSDLEKKDHENDANAYLWGTSTGVKAMANDLIDAHNEESYKASAKDKRKARKAEAEKARKLLSASTDQDIDNEAEGGCCLVRMNVRAVTGRSSLDKARDVQVRNVTLSLDNGTVLLESGELKFAYRRRYGLIGENGVGKVGIFCFCSLRLSDNSGEVVFGVSRYF